MNRRQAALSLLSMATLSMTALVAGEGIAHAQPGPPPNRYPPPPPRREERVPPPRRGHYWQPGHWRWNGSTYVWAGGYWVAGPMRRGHYVHGRWAWAPGRRQWVWQPAHWE